MTLVHDPVNAAIISIWVRVALNIWVHQEMQRAKAFIIHLERAVERKQQVARILDQLPIPAEVFPAFDGAAANTSPFANYQKNLLSPRYPFSLNAAEAATFESHRRCWRKIVEDDLDYGLVVEDDVEFDRPLFRLAWDLVAQNLERGDIVRFPVKPRETGRYVVETSSFTRLFYPRNIGLGMVCQVVTKEAAQKLLEITEKFDRPVDTFLQLSWLHNIRILSCYPNGVREISSILGGSTIQTKLPFWTKISRELLRPIYRLKLRAYCYIRETEHAKNKEDQSLFKSRNKT